MKLVILFKGLFALLFLSLQTSAQSNDPVKKANQLNDKKAKIKMIDDDDATFLVQAADARMMDKTEGAMAIKKGTTKNIRQYGQLMVKDQQFLLNKIKQLAVDRNITLPSGISDTKQSGREDLAGKNGKDFDKKFIKMMRIDHERDVKMFAKAKSANDQTISAFATRYLPMIQSHLNKIKTIEANMQN